MRHAVLALALALAAAAAPVAATSLSSTFTVASDYLFDGVSQTQNDPALQASLDWSHDSGFYLGTWASNVDFGPGDPAEIEVDLYGGYATSFESGWGWTAGFARYTYTGAPASYDYTEWTAGLTFPTTTTLQGWITDDEALGGEAWRLKAKHSIALPNEFSLDLEATRTAFDDPGRSDFSHGQIGVSREIGQFKAYLGYSDTNQSGNELADGRFLFTLSTTVAWLD